jgi:hypothetical protein
MHDPILAGLKVFALAIWQLFNLVVILPLKLLLRLFLTTDFQRADGKKNKTVRNENERQAGCREVVMFYATSQGYIARECMSREEIEQRIDSGINPKDLAVEIQARINARPGIILGKQSYAGYDIKLPYSYRNRHAYIVGRSGSGKTNLIRNMLLQDLAFGSGVGVLAPEQKLLTEEILPYIPEDRIDDVVYVNPADTQYPVPFNPLHLDEGEDIDLRVDDTLTIFKRLMGDTGARMDEILRQSLYALLERPGSTLLDIERLLVRHDNSFRSEIINTTADAQTAYFFRDVYPSYPKDAHLPITTRIGRLVRPRLVRTLLCQPGKSFNFREAMDEGKILLFNLSDGLLGEQTSQLLGQLIVSKIQMAVMSRVDTPAAARRPFYLYLDEFQIFTGVAETSYEKLLSRARKYRLGLTLAHQQTSQLSSSLLREILGNVSTILAFNISHADATKLCHEFVIDMGAEADHIPPEELLRLKVGDAWGKIGKTVFPLKTWLADQHPDPVRAKFVIEQSRINYGHPAIDESSSRFSGSLKIHAQNGAAAQPVRVVPQNEEPFPDPAKVF